MRKVLRQGRFFRGGSLPAALAAAGMGAAWSWPATATAADLSFSRHIIATDNTGVRCISAADLDNDGDMDVLSAITEDHLFKWYESDGNPVPGFTEHLVDNLALRANFVLAADMDGDTDLDILGSSGLDDGVEWYENIGGSPPTFYKRVITKDPNGEGQDPPGFADGVRQVFAADLDGDNDLDVGSVSVKDDQVAWYENDGGSPPTFTPWVLTNSLDGARAITAADLDGDNDIDIIAGAWFDDRMLWFENDGNQPVTFTEHVLVTYPVGNDPNEVAANWRVFATDLDGDLDLDVLTTRRFDGVEWLENDGGTPPTFTRWTIVPGEDANLGKSVNAADLDDDGDVDPMSASSHDDKIAWYENTGGDRPVFVQVALTEDPDGPPPAGGPLQGVADGARSVFAADVDGDGDTDILWGAKFSSTIAWEENELIDLTPPCPPDLDGDGNVGISDLLGLLEAWGTNPGGPPDLDGDFTVGVTDLLQLLASWGPCPQLAACGDGAAAGTATTPTARRAATTGRAARRSVP